LTQWRAVADLIVVLTEWNEFRALDLSRVREVVFGNALSICAMCTPKR